MIDLGFGNLFLYSLMGFLSFGIPAMAFFSVVSTFLRAIARALFVR